MRTPTVVVARSLEMPDAPRRFSLRQVAHVLLKRKGTLLLGCVAGAVAMAVLSSFYPVARFEAVAQWLVTPDEVSLPGERPVATRSPGADEQIARTIRLLAGRSLAEDVVREIGADTLYPGLAQRIGPDPKRRLQAAADRLSNSLDVRPAGRSSIVSISFLHASPVLAAQVVNTLGEKYVDRHVRVQTDARAQAFFREQAERARARLESSRQALAAFARLHGVEGSLDDARTRASTDLAALRAALEQSRSVRAALEADQAAIASTLKREALVPETWYREKERLAELELREQELMRNFTDEHPTLREVREQIAALRIRVSRPDAASSPYETRTEQEQARVAAQSERLRVRSEMQSARAREQGLLAQRDEAQQRLQALRSIEEPMRRLRQQVDADEQSWRAYAARVEHERQAEEMAAQQVIGVRVIERAEVPVEPLPSRFTPRWWMGLILGLGAGAVAAFLLEFVRGRLDTRDDVERALGVPVLVTIMEMPRSGRLGLSRPRHAAP